MKSWKNEHTFAICAYGESPYLEECIRSVRRQSVSSDVILITSTPCAYIQNMCTKYGIPCYINTGEAGITQDWNFAYKKAGTPIVTLAHQDDIYFKRYTEYLISMYRRSSRPLIFFSDYCEVRNGRIIKNNTLLYIKRLMLFPLRFRILQKNRWLRRRILSFGSPICCPSVAYFRPNLPETVFLNHFRTNQDWEAWERLSRQKGQFLYCREKLMAHRIHKDSETSAAIRESGRMKEDMEMYRKFWPKWAAVILSRWYKKSEDFNHT